MLLIRFTILNLFGFCIILSFVLLFRLLLMIDNDWDWFTSIDEASLFLFKCKSNLVLLGVFKVFIFMTFFISILYARTLIGDHVYNINKNKKFTQGDLMTVIFSTSNHSFLKCRN